MHNILIDLIDSLSAIKDVSELNCQADSEAQLVRDMLAIIIRKYDMTQCSFFLLNESGYLTNVTGLSFDEQLTPPLADRKPIQFKLGEGIIGMAAQAREVQNCQNCQEDQRFFHESGGYTSLGSILCVPIFLTADKLIGVLNISHPVAYHFTEWHVRMLSIYRNLLGQLITNYRLFQEMEIQISLRTLKLESSLKDLNALKDHYEIMSMIDPLTELYNRRYFYDHVDIAIAKTKRYGESLCLLMLDLDHFKAANDKFGHLFGDVVLVKVAQVLRSAVRDTDVLARFGGEEFIVLFSNTNAVSGELFAERIRKKIQSIVWKEQPEFSQTISIGLYCLDNNELSDNMDLGIEPFIYRADLALYHAKKLGRNRVVRFTEDMQEK